MFPLGNPKSTVFIITITYTLFSPENQFESHVYCYSVCELIIWLAEIVLLRKKSMFFKIQFNLYILQSKIKC